MIEKEKEIQRALGLLKTYDGYVQMKGNTYYDVYEVQDVTLEGAKQQIEAIMAKLQQKSGKLATLFSIQENDYYDAAIKSLKIRRREINGTRHNIKS